MVCGVLTLGWDHYYCDTFENINIKASSVLEEPEVLWGMEDGLIRGLIFKNVTLGEQNIEGVEFFQTNEFVFN